MWGRRGSGLFHHVQSWVMYFFDVCVCVLGIDSLVRSLKEAFRLTTLEVPKQGLLLLTEILGRCGHTVMPFLFHAFMSCPIAKIIPLHWTCSALENSCTEHLCQVTKMMSLHFSSAMSHQGKALLWQIKGLQLNLGITEESLNKRAGISVRRSLLFPVNVTHCIGQKYIFCFSKNGKAMFLSSNMTFLLWPFSIKEIFHHLML